MAAESSKLRHVTAGDEVEIVTVTVRDLELTRKVMVHGHLIDMTGTVPEVNVEHIGRPGQDLDEARVAERIEAKVRRHPDDPSRWSI
jgi:hypothetical protein